MVKTSDDSVPGPFKWSFRIPSSTLGLGEPTMPSRPPKNVSRVEYESATAPANLLSRSLFVAAPTLCSVRTSLQTISTTVAKKALVPRSWATCSRDFRPLTYAKAVPGSLARCSAASGASSAVATARCTPTPLIHSTMRHASVGLPSSSGSSSRVTSSASTPLARDAASACGVAVLQAQIADAINL